MTKRTNMNIMNQAKKIDEELKVKKEQQKQIDQQRQQNIQIQKEIAEKELTAILKDICKDKRFKPKKIDKNKRHWFEYKYITYKDKDVIRAKIDWIPPSSYYNRDYGCEVESGGYWAINFGLKERSGNWYQFTSSSEYIDKELPEKLARWLVNLKDNFG